MVTLNSNPFTVDNSKSKKLGDIKNGYLKEVKGVCNKRVTTLIAQRELLIKKNEVLRVNSRLQKKNLILKEDNLLQTNGKENPEKKEELKKKEEILEILTKENDLLKEDVRHLVDDKVCSIIGDNKNKTEFEAFEERLEEKSNLSKGIPLSSYFNLLFFVFLLFFYIVIWKTIWGWIIIFFTSLYDWLSPKRKL